jgi:hypothetical protein
MTRQCFINRSRLFEALRDANERDERLEGDDEMREGQQNYNKFAFNCFGARHRQQHEVSRLETKKFSLLLREAAH